MSLKINTSKDTLVSIFRYQGHESDASVESDASGGSDASYYESDNSDFPEQSQDNLTVEGIEDRDINDIPSNPGRAQKTSVFQSLRLTLGEIARPEWLQNDVDDAMIEVAQELKDMKEHPTFKDDEEVPRALKKIRFFHKMFRRLKRYEKPADYLTFSMLREPIYDRLGIKELPRVTIERCVFHKDASQQYWDQAEACNSRGISGHLSTSLAAWGEEGEPRTRVLVGPILRDAARCCINEGDDIMIIPELIIAGKRKPVIIESLDCKTLLTGSVDYCVFRSLATAKQEAKLGKVDLLSKLKDILNVFNKRASVPQVEPSLYELKPDILSENLEKRLPQVLVETIGVCVVSQTRGMKWCLTTGSRWLFGLIEAKEVGGWTSFHYRVVQDFELPLEGETGFASDLHNLFLFLVYWMNQPFRKIRDLCHEKDTKKSSEEEKLDREDEVEEKSRQRARKAAPKKKTPKEKVIRESAKVEGTEGERQDAEGSGKRRSRRLQSKY